MYQQGHSRGKLNLFLHNSFHPNLVLLTVISTIYSQILAHFMQESKQIVMKLNSIWKAGFLLGIGHSLFVFPAESLFAY